MSLPHIPHIAPKITLTEREAKHLLLASIAMEEMALSHILNAEGEKIQAAIGCSTCIDDLLKVNKSVQSTLRDVIKNQLLLLMKLEDVVQIPDRPCQDPDDGCEE